MSYSTDSGPVMSMDGDQENGGGGANGIEGHELSEEREVSADQGYEGKLAEI